MYLKNNLANKQKKVKRYFFKQCKGGNTCKLKKNMLHKRKGSQSLVGVACMCKGCCKLMQTS